MAKRNAYTMLDLARLAGVSVSTVSAVINNKGIVSTELIFGDESTREKSK